MRYGNERRNIIPITYNCKILIHYVLDIIKLALVANLILWISQSGPWDLVLWRRGLHYI